MARVVGTAWQPGQSAGPSLEMRVQQLEQLLAQERQRQRSALQALEQRILRLEGTGVASTSSERAAIAVAPSCTDPEKSFLEISSDDDDDEEGNCCLLPDKDGSVEVVQQEELVESYGFEESMWDVSVFAFMPCLGVGHSANVMLLLLLNMITQGFFIWVVHEYMCEDSMSSEFLESLLKFRSSVAHSIKYADMMQGMSLASQVCGEDEKIPFAGMQLGLIGDIGNARHGGIYLCTLAVLLWLLTLIGEMDSSLRFGSAMASLLKGRRTLLLMGKAEGEGDFVDGGSGELRLESLSVERYVFVLAFVVLPRLVIVFMLAYIGIQFLVVTTSMGDLLLNSMALAFITDIDNMLFAAFAPQRLKSIVRSVAPVTLPTQSSRKCRFNGLSTLSKVALVTVILVTVFFQLIWPFYWRMNQAYDILCSGERNFVYAVNAATDLVEVVPTFTEPITDWARQELSVLQLAKPKLRAGPGFHPPERVLRTIQNGSQTAIFQLSMADTRQRLQEVQMDAFGRTPNQRSPHLNELTPSIPMLFELRRTLSENVLEGTADLVCGDMTFSTVEGVMKVTIKEVTGGLSDCRGVEHMCSWINMTSLRALCPVTCGCRDLVHPAASFFAGPGFGCPMKCEKDVMVLKQWRKMPPSIIQCVDASPQKMLEDPFIREYLQMALNWILSKSQILLTAHSALVDDGASIGIPKAEAGKAFRSIVDGRFLDNVQSGHWDLAPGHPHPRGLQGCRFWTSWEVRFMLGIDFCNAVKFRSLRPYCPTSCGCRKGQRQCPPSCPSSGDTPSARTFGQEDPLDTLDP